MRRVGPKLQLRGQRRVSTSSLRGIMARKLRATKNEGENICFTNRIVRFLSVTCCAALALLTSDCSPPSTLASLTDVSPTVSPIFSLSISPSNLSINQGGAGVAEVIVGGQNGFNGNVNLSTAALPNGLLATFSPSVAGTQSTLTFTSSGSTIAGAYTVSVTGTATGGLQASASVTVVVLPSPPRFSLSASPNRLTINQGAASSTEVTVGAQDGFVGTVELSVKGLPTGVVANFQPISLIGSGNSALTLTITSLSAAGSYPLIVGGLSRNLTETVDLTLIIPSTPAKVSLNVLSFPGASSDPYFRTDVPEYLYGNPTVSGATIAIEWGGSDPGGGQYDWSYPDSQIRPWIQAGKKVNLVIWAIADNSSTKCGPEGQYGLSGTGNCAVPSYVWNALGSPNITTCTSQYGTQQMPNYFAPAFQSNYQDFMTAVVQHYVQNPGIGYIRFGLGHGGESEPVAGWDDISTECGQAYVNGWGLSVTTWEQYIASMLSFEGSRNSAVQLMLGITPMGNPGDVVPEYAAPVAVQNGIGFGSQGLEQSDVNNCAGSTADWCSLFNEYTGRVPLELQTLGQSCPTGGCKTGSLDDLIPFAVSNRATILEIYYQDWLTAFDPGYPGYFPAYQNILQATLSDD
jgi:hypothetical protein